ncbi:3-hydroxyisobutyrate dehydrogenase-like, NAD-binding domain [Dillenia turbinata]|uniref:3-hydroxyisobutyrate dehydrogenase-like, NAD-binding domain n=1 Tax=Dillenia turbinata TaxID=194707 RepID=A0AAN8YZU7_9MAGN
MGPQTKVGFVGLDDLSLELTASLLRSGYAVQAFEIFGPLMDDFSKSGGIKCACPAEAGKDVAALVVLISHIDQVNETMFGQHGALQGLCKDTVIILRSTIDTQYVQQFEEHLKEIAQTHLLVDAYVCRGKSEALDGKVMIACSGKSDAIARVERILSAMCSRLYTFKSEVGTASKIKLVNELLEGIHLVASSEALVLGTQAGIHPWIIYDIISNAAGNSWVFKNHVPQVLRGNLTKHHFLNNLVQVLRNILDVATMLKFPLPLLAVAHQQLIAGSSHGHGDDDDVTLLKVWEKVLGINIANAANAETYSPEHLAEQVTRHSNSVNRIGFIGLGAMGFGMAIHLLKSNFCVIGYDVYEPTLSRFVKAGGMIGSSPAEISKDVDVLVIMVTNEAQAQSVLYGELGAVAGNLDKRPNCIKVSAEGKRRVIIRWISGRDRQNALADDFDSDGFQVLGDKGDETRALIWAEGRLRRSGKICAKGG